MSALRASSPGIRSSSAGEGCGEEADEGADDEDRMLQRRIGLPVWPREAARAKANAVHVNNRKRGVLLFVGNLPFKVSIRWLFMTFRRFGKVIDVFIPEKLSRVFGRKFGFVRFVSDCDAQQAIRGMHGSLIGSWNLIVQRAKPKSGSYDSPMSKRKFCSESFPNNSRSSRGFSENGSPGFTCQGVGIVSDTKKSGAHKGLDAINSSGSLSQVDGKFVACKQRISFVGQEVDSFNCGALSQEKGKSGSRKRILGMSKDSDWDLRAAIALLRDGKLFLDMRSIIMETCSFVRSISLIKDNIVLIMFQSPFHRGLAIDHGLWAHWFYSVRAWEEGKAEGENRIWVECRGIPFCAWNDITFEAIASVWGSIVEVDRETSDMVHLSFARFCISTNYCEIEDTIELQVGDKIFDISVSGSNVQKNNSANMMASNFLGPQQNVPFSKSAKGDFDHIEYLGSSSMRDCSHGKSHSTEKAVSDNKVMQRKPLINADMISAVPPLQASLGRKFLVQDEKEFLDHGSHSHAVRSMSTGGLSSEISSMHESMKPGDDKVFLPLCDEAKLELLDVNSAVQEEVIGAGYVGDGLHGCVSGTVSILEECNMMYSKEVGLVKKGHLQRTNAESKGLDCGLSKVAESKVPDSGMITETEQAGKDQGLKFVTHVGGVHSRSKFEATPGETKVYHSNPIGGVSVMISKSESDHGFSGNCVSASMKSAEYNKEIVIPVRFLAMSGSLNISKASFYALCNRLIEVIDEILDMSSNMGIYFSIEAQKGIKDVMTSRQTRALSMIMDSL